jgi:hypothetical protein
MSDAHSESPIKTPNQLIAVIVASFVVPIATILLLVNFVGNTSKLGADSASQSPEAVAERIRPVADVSFTMPDQPEGAPASRSTTLHAQPAMAQGLPALPRRVTQAPGRHVSVKAMTRWSHTRSKAFAVCPPRAVMPVWMTLKSRAP